MPRPQRRLAPPLQSQNWDISQLPGLSQRDQSLLLNCGIQTTRQLLQNTKTAAQRQGLATRLQIHPQWVNKWVALADLARVPAVGCQYCGLLLHAGVSSLPQLAEISLPRLHQQILKLQVSMMQRPDLCPGLEQVAEWIQQARCLNQSVPRG
jgi:hypothetical protein